MGINNAKTEGETNTRVVGRIVRIKSRWSHFVVCARCKSGFKCTRPNNQRKKPFNFFCYKLCFFSSLLNVFLNIFMFS